MSHLHSRKRGGISPPSEVQSAAEGFRHKRIRGSCSSDLRYGLTVVVSFLCIGLMLGYLILHHQHRKVILHVMQDPWNRGDTGLHPINIPAPRYVTVVLPSVVNPLGRTQRLQSITDTWGPLARAIFVVHNVSEFPSTSHGHYSQDATPTDPYSFPQLLVVPPTITPDQGLPRLNHVIRQVYESISPDFAFFVNDHTFVIPEHVCHFLSQKDPELDMYVGHALKNGPDAFNSGAAGYILSRSTIAKLVQTWDNQDPTCLLKDGTKWLQENPGLVTAQCLSKVLQIKAEDTRQDGKWHRFHAFGLVRMVEGNVDQWYIDKHKDLTHLTGFDESYATLLRGMDCCSEETVSFHYVEHVETRALFKTRQLLVENAHVSDQDLKAFMIREWPKEAKDIGAYAHMLPHENDDSNWIPLLGVVRNITSSYASLEC